MNPEAVFPSGVAREFYINPDGAFSAGFAEKVERGTAVVGGWLAATWSAE